MEFPQELIDVLKTAKRVAVLTGAGVSQESGLRTFRDAQSGLWAQYRPEELASPQAFKRDPRLIWDWYAMRRGQVQEVKPNRGHFALAEFRHLFEQFTLVTQNVDGLHQAAGSTGVIELHGNLAQVRCSKCGVLTGSWDEAPEGGVPVCRMCGGLLRPNVVWFGEALPREGLELAAAAARGCDVFFTIGTSGVVQPAASLAAAARNKQAVLVQVNLDPEPVISGVNFVLAGRSGEVLPALLEAVRMAG